MLPEGAKPNLGGAAELRLQAADITAIDIWDLERGRLVAHISQAQTRALRPLFVGGVVMTDTWTATAPLWNVALVITTGRGGFIAHPVGPCALRLNPSQPLSPQIFNQRGVPITTSELRMKDCGSALFDVLVDHLGPPTRKDYPSAPRRH